MDFKLAEQDDWRKQSCGCKYLSDWFVKKEKVLTANESFLKQKKGSFYKKKVKEVKLGSFQREGGRRGQMDEEKNEIKNIVSDYEERVKTYTVTFNANGGYYEIDNITINIF